MTASKDAPELRSVESGEVIKGVMALLFTPFTNDGFRFDPASMRRQFDFVRESGVSSVVACGKAGEFEGQSLEEIEEVLTTVLEHVNGRVPGGHWHYQRRGGPRPARGGARAPMRRRLRHDQEADQGGPARLLQPDR